MAGAPDYRAEKGNMNLLKIRNFKTTTWGNDDSGSINSAANTVQTKGDIAIISYRESNVQTGSKWCLVRSWWSVHVLPEWISIVWCKESDVLAKTRKHWGRNWRSVLAFPRGSNIFRIRDSRVQAESWCKRGTGMWWRSTQNVLVDHWLKMWWKYMRILLYVIIKLIKTLKIVFNHKLIKKIQIMFHQTQITALICVKLMGT